MVAESQNRTRGKIQAAKKWLTRAEDHFDRNAPVRGELDLLLAEAELRSTRENLQSRPGAMKLSWFQQGIAFGLAALLVAIGAGSAWWWQSDRTGLAVPLAVLPVNPVRQAQTQNIPAAPLQKTETPPAAAVETKIPAQEVKSVEKSANSEPSVSPDEMHRLIQAAGQSLRGRTKP